MSGEAGCALFARPRISIQAGLALHKDMSPSVSGHRPDTMLAWPEVIAGLPGVGSPACWLRRQLR